MGALKVPLHQKGYSTYHQLTLQRKVSSGLVDKLDHILVSSRFIWKVNRKFSDHLQHLYRRIKLANGVRAGIYCSEPDLMQLPEYCSIFQAQVCVVRKSAEIANNAGNNIKNTDICVRRQPGGSSKNNLTSLYVIECPQKKGCSRCSGFRKVAAYTLGFYRHSNCNQINFCCFSFGVLLSTTEALTEQLIIC